MKSSLMMLIASCGEGCVQAGKAHQVQSTASRLGIRVFSVSGCTHTGQRRGGRVPILPRVSVSCSKPLELCLAGSEKNSVAIRAYSQPAWKI